MTRFKMITNRFYVLMLVALGCVCYGEHLLICPAKIKSFSFGTNSEYYYNCTTEGAVPSLERCPENKVYWAAKEKCSSTFKSNGNFDSFSEDADLHTFSQHVLGRPVYLGCLFDAKKSEIMASDSFWKRETVAKNKQTSVSFSSNLHSFAAQSTSDRLSHMEFDASLRIDILGGLITVEGSASYLKDTVESENTVAVVMTSHYNTRSETLPTTTKKDFSDLCKLKGPTHVVTSIQYGMDANFVFQQTAKSSESREKVTGSLKIAVHVFPLIKISIGSKVEISGKLKKIIKNIDVKLFGDFVLDNQPTTYEESVRAYKTLTSHLGTSPNYTNAAKMKMQLTPITRFCDEKTAILVGISDMLLASVTTMLDQIERTNLNAKTLAMADCVNKFLPLQKMMSMFISKLGLLELELKSELQTLLPNIRGGGASGGEKGLVALLTKYRNSPFNYDNADSFLKIRKREIKILDYILDPATFERTEVKVLRFEEAIDAKILFTKNLVVMLKFNILPSVNIMNKFLEGKDVDESTSWFNAQQIISTMGKVFKSFMKFASVNRDANDRGYLVAISNAKKDFLNVFAQKEGVILSSNFQFPQLPTKMTTIANNYNSIIFQVRKPNNTWVTNFDIKYWKYAREGSFIEKRFKFGKESTENVEVTGLSPNEVYQFSIKHVTEMGTSPSVPEYIIEITRPCSIPRNVRVKDLSTTSFSILWDAPLHYGIGVQIDNYKVKVLGTDSKVVASKIVDGELHAVFTQLNATSIFNVVIQANANTQIYNETGEPKEKTPVSRSAVLRVVTRPDALPAPSLRSISYHSAEITWSSPAKIAAGATVEYYIVKYSMTNDGGNDTITGTGVVRSSGNIVFANISSFAQGTTYAVSVKVVTTLGSSEDSPPLILTTSYKRNELVSFRTSLQQEINQNISEMSGNIYKKITTESSQIQLIEANVTMIVRGALYKAVYVGLGYGYFDTCVNKSVVTAGECINWCYNQRQLDSSIDGLNYFIPERHCDCHRGDHGHKADDRYIHYKLF